eukprot:g66989.t1
MSHGFVPLVPVCARSKRFIVVNNQAFIDGFVKAVANLKVGDPLAASTNISPLARATYAQAMKDFVVDATSKGAQVLVGGTAPAGLDGAGSAYFLPTVVAGVAPGMRMWDEEVFGPVAALICVKDVAEAVRVANATRFGLGASIWTADTEQGMALARQINSGNVFVNHIVASHPSLPFGGVGVSGFGRELAELGLREFRLYREALGGLTLNSTGLKSAALSGLQQSGQLKGLALAVTDPAGPRTTDITFKFTEATVLDYYSMSVHSAAELGKVGRTIAAKSSGDIGLC